jgi:hypothetical protein
MKAVWRKPASTSNRLSCAPGWGRSLRTITREPSGHLDRSNKRVTSATKAPSRTDPSSSTAFLQERLDTAEIAQRTSFVIGKPKLNAHPASSQAAAKSWVAPAESLRTRTDGLERSPLTGRA